MKWNFSNYFDSEYWASFFSKSKRMNYSLIKGSRIALAAIRGFKEDDCWAKGSSLTFYSLLSIVPVLAVAFGIAKGFGFQERLESELAQRFVEQKEVVDKLIYFSYQALQNTQSGLIAGVGLIVLFWSVLKLLSNIESSFNAIWKVKKPRTFARSVSDYLAMMLFCPIFFAASSSLSVFITTQISDYSKNPGIWSALSPLAYAVLQVFPYVLSWLLFTALYSVMPNTKVPIKYAFIAGVCAGTAYQVVQYIYIHFQIGLASYGAIYGSFAALPLFLIWLNTSWLIALAGAEIAYHSENDRFNYAFSSSKSTRQADARVLGLLVMQDCARAFSEGLPPPSVYNLAQSTGIPVVSIRHIVQQLIDAGLLMEVNWQGNSGEFYHPSRNLKSITMKEICDALDSSRQDIYNMVYDEDVERYKKALSAADQLLAGSHINPSIEQLSVISTDKRLIDG